VPNQAGTVEDGGLIGQESGVVLNDPVLKVSGDFLPKKFGRFGGCLLNSLR